AVRVHDQDAAHAVGNEVQLRAALEGDLLPIRGPVRLLVEVVRGSGRDAVALRAVRIRDNDLLSQRTGPEPVAAVGDLPVPAGRRGAGGKNRASDGQEESREE